MPKLLFPDDTLLTYSDQSSSFASIWEDGVTIDLNEHDLSNLSFLRAPLPIHKMTDFSMTDTGGIIVSERLKVALQNAGVDNLDYYPASIFDSKGVTAQLRYYAVNIIGLVACIDIERSQFKGRTIDGELKGIRRFYQLYLTTPPTTENTFYRVKLFRRLMVISSNAQALFEQHKFSGIKLIEPSLWDGFSGEVSESFV